MKMVGLLCENQRIICAFLGSCFAILNFEESKALIILLCLYCSVLTSVY